MREKNKEINKDWINKGIKNNFVNFEPYEKYTVFGMDNFIEPRMIIVNRQVEQYVVDEVFKVSQKIRVDVDKSKLEKWLDLCVKLDNIEETDLIDFATKKRFAKLKEQYDKEKEETKSVLREIKKLLKGEAE